MADAEGQAPPEDVRLFRDVLGRFASGVVVVTGLVDGTPYGLTCQSFFSASLEPPLTAVSPSLRSSSWERIATTGAFAVSVLRADQQALCLTFGRGGVQDKFASAGWEPGPATGSPLIHGALAWLDCTIEAVHPSGDHHLVLGRVQHLAASPRAGAPLMFSRGRFATLAIAPDEPRDWAEDLWGDAPAIDAVDW